MWVGALAGIVALAFAIEGALGFGATLVAVTLSSFLITPAELLPVFVPLNMVLSASIVLRAWRAVDVRLLLTRVVPLMGIGLPLGMFIARAVDATILVRIFGVFVLVLAALELRPPGKSLSPRRGVGDALAPLLLVLGGVMHGAFGTGGPFAVYAIGKKLEDKAAFRATLSALWLILNTVLVSGFIVDGRMAQVSAVRAASLAGALAFGIVVGEVLHRAVPSGVFKRAVWTGLALAGLALALR